MPKILIIGDDLRLIESRSAVIAISHANVTCYSSRDLEQSLDGPEPEIVVICHSLPFKVACEFTSKAKRAWPDTHILKVLSGGVETDSDFGEDSSTVAEPSQLRNHVEAILGVNLTTK